MQNTKISGACKHCIAVRLICLLLIGVTLLLAGCSRTADGDDGHQALCERFLDAVLEADEDAAYALFDADLGLDREGFSGGFADICLMFDGLEVQQIQQVGWLVETKNGRTSRQTTFEVDTSNGKSFTVRLITVDGYDGIYDVFVRDNSDFEEEAGRFTILNIILKVLSALFFVGTVVLIVDCIRSKIRRRVLWAIVMLLGLAFTLSLNGSGLNLHFTIGMIMTVMGVAFDAAEATVAITFYLPIGAIVYLFRRGHLRRVAEEEERLRSSFDLPPVPKTPGATDADARKPSDSDQNGSDGE